MCSPPQSEYLTKTIQERDFWQTLFFKDKAASCETFSKSKTWNFKPKFIERNLFALVARNERLSNKALSTTEGHVDYH